MGFKSTDRRHNAEHDRIAAELLAQDVRNPDSPASALLSTTIAGGVRETALIRPADLSGTKYAPRRVTVGRPLVVYSDGLYNAWPDICRTGTGRLLAAWSNGTGHDVAGQKLEVTRSDNDGASWSAPQVAFAPTGNQRMKALHPGAHGDLIYALGWYSDTTANPITGTIFASRSTDDGMTWTAPESIAQPFTRLSAIEQGVLVTQSGKWLTAAYGSSDALANYSVAIGSSVNQGAAWSWSTIVVGDPSNVWTEPTLAQLRDGTIVCLIRNNLDNNIWRTISADDGATWSAPAIAFAGTGRPTTIASSASGTLIVLYRDAGITHGAIRLSNDGGATWTAPTFFLSGAAYQYAGVFEYAPGVYGVAAARERVTNLSDIEFSYFAEPGVQTPFADSNFHLRTPQAAMSRTSRMLAYDTLDRADETPIRATDSGLMWTPFIGTFNLIGGRIKPGANTSGMIVGFDVNRADYHEIVSSILTTVSSWNGAFVFQLADQNNYYRLQFSGAVGSATVTLYKVVSNVPTSIAVGAAPLNLGAGIEYPVRITIRNGRIKAWVDEEKIIDVTDTTYTTNKRIGVMSTGATMVTEFGPITVLS